MTGSLVFAMACLWCSAAFAAEEPPGKPALKIVEPNLVLSVDPATNAASGLIYLSNPTEKAIPLSLSADDFKSSTSAYGLNTKTVFAVQPPSGTPAPAQQVLVTTLEPSATIAVKVDVSSFWEAGEAIADLRNFGIPIGKLRATKWRPPFAVKIVAPVPDKPEFTFTKGNKRQITLKNDDAMTYLVAVDAEVDGTWSPPETVTLPPSSSVTVKLDPPKAWFPGSAGVKETVRDGNIRLKWQVANTGGQPVPERIMPFKARLNALSEFWQALWGYLFVLFFLTLGGVCSMVLSNWVPNRLSRADAEEQLNDLARQTTGLSTRIDSGLRVFLRVERNRLHRLLRSRWIFSANFPEVVKQVSDKIAALGRQVDLARQLDRAREALEPLLQSEPIPVKIDEIDRDLQKSADLLRRCDCTGVDFDAAKTLILGATDRIGKMDSIDEVVAAKLTDRIKSLQSYLEKDAEAGALKELKTLFPKLFESFRAAANEKLEPRKYSLVDFVTARLDLIRRYQGHFNPNPPLPNFPKQKEGVKYFHTNTITGLRRANLLLKEIKEGFYVEDIERAIQKNEVKIVVEPAAPVEDQLLRFSIRFDSEELNEASAREELRCEWDFGHNAGAASPTVPGAPEVPGLENLKETPFKVPTVNNLTETGWEAFHYFPPPRRGCRDGLRQFLRGFWPWRKRASNPYPITATFSKRFPDLDPPDPDSPQPVVVSPPLVIQRNIKVSEPPESGGSDRNLAEGVRLGIALIIALIGLLAGARDQLTKLDLIPAAIAVFLLGFGADTIKNLISPKQSPQPAKPAAS